MAEHSCAWLHCCALYLDHHLRIQMAYTLLGMMLSSLWYWFLGFQWVHEHVYVHIATENYIPRLLLLEVLLMISLEDWVVSSWLLPSYNWVNKLHIVVQVYSQAFFTCKIMSFIFEMKLVFNGSHCCDSCLVLLFELSVLLGSFSPNFLDLSRSAVRTGQINNSWVTHLILFTSGHTWERCKLGRHGKGG